MSKRLLAFGQRSNYFDDCVVEENSFSPSYKEQWLYADNNVRREISAVLFSNDN